MKQHETAAERRSTPTLSEPPPAGFAVSAPIRVHLRLHVAFRPMNRAVPTVLIIEDEAPIRANLERFLKAEGYAVLTASDGADGIAAARKHRPELIICDILMPRVDGYAVLAQLRADPGMAGIPLIFLTASADKEDRQRGLASGATDYVTKPFKLAELLAVIREHLGAGTSKGN